MAKITYVEFDGTEKTFEIPTGLSVMEGAVRNGVEGVVAECGGACSCATCHVYVDDAWLDLIGTRTDTEDSMLDYAEDVRPNSRLSCQIRVTDGLDGLVVRCPETQ